MYYAMGHDDMVCSMVHVFTSAEGRDAWVRERWWDRGPIEGNWLPTEILMRGMAVLHGDARLPTRCTDVYTWRYRREEDGTVTAFADKR